MIIYTIVILIGDLYSCFSREEFQLAHMQEHILLVVHISSQYLIVRAKSKVIRSGRVRGCRASRTAGFLFFESLLCLKLSHFLLHFVM